MKITGDALCPGCNKEHPVSFDIDKLEVTKPVIAPTSILNHATTQLTQQLDAPIVEQPKVIVKIPKNIPKYKCKNCDKNHENKDYSERSKFKCEKCGQFSSDGKSCLFCNNTEDFEELDDDELDDMGIPRPQEQEHIHE